MDLDSGGFPKIRLAAGDTPRPACRYRWLREQDWNLRPSGYLSRITARSNPVIRGLLALASLKCVGGPDTSASSQSDELASRPPNAREMAVPMHSAAASVSRSPTWA